MSKRTGAIQIDYIIAAGIFIAVFAYLISYTTGYYSSVKDTSDILVLRSEAFGLQGIADREPEPVTWPELQPDNGMVLLMHFNNDTLDYSGLGNNGTPTNGASCSSSVAGRFRSACSFDGIDDFINITNSTSLNLSNAFTLEAWVNINNLSASLQHFVISRYHWGQSKGYGLMVRNDGLIRCDFNGTTGQFTSSSSYVTAGNWYHLGCVYNGSTLSIIVNGIARESASRSGLVDYNYNLYVGMPTDNIMDIYAFNGTIDEVAVYNRSLTAAEILANYQQGLQRIGLQSYAYRFYILANYSQPFRRNQTANTSDLANERVNFSLSSILPEADVFSVAIYNSSGASVPYQISDKGGKNITFSANIAMNTSQWFTVYVDDDTVFPDTSATITGGDNITETVFPAEKISLLQYEKIRQLSLSNYTDVRSISDIKNNFNIKIVDTGNNQTFMEFGNAPPRRGNVIALQRYIIFQNATAAIRNGRFIVQSWK